jgi:hypothetical protein
MEIDLDTFLITVYCLVDDLYRARLAPHKPHRPGQRPELSDSEALTLLLLAQWQQDRSERAFLRYAVAHLRPYFPRLLSQSAFNRRARDLAGAVTALGRLLAHAQPDPTDPPAAYGLLDGVPVPLARCCRGQRHRCFAAEAGIGHGGTDDAWVYGVRLLTVVSPAGPITGWLAGPAATGERWLAEALLRWRQDPTAPPPTAGDLAPVLGASHHRGGERLGPTGPLAPVGAVGDPAATPYLADLGFAGAAWRQHWQAAYGATILTKADYATLPPTERAPLDRWFCGLRQTVETVYGWLTDRLGLKFPRARTYWGLLTRLAAKVAAFNLAMLLNRLFHRPTFAHLSPLG